MGATRFSISMPDDLVEQLDAMTREQGYANRSQAVTQMVRDTLDEHRSQCDVCEIAGTITLIYDHHTRNIQKLLTDIQHDHGEVIIAAMHVHLDHHTCMEVLAVRGRSAVVRATADRLVTAKGIRHGRFTVTTTKGK